ncbi:hypothetical protein C8T65DRAFT_659143 [Cerioporus squamosus]|nr:hypothetical protein C8T65DRAFT_659143 [Cerioporus squamosus]
MSPYSILRSRLVDSEETLVDSPHTPPPSQTVRFIIPESSSESAWSSTLPREISPQEEYSLTQSMLSTIRFPREELDQARFETGKECAGWPKLDQYIASDSLPDMLVVERGSRIAAAAHAPFPPVLYVRARPHLARDGVTWSFADARELRKEVSKAEPRVAHLWWDEDDPELMYGSHGYVRRAAFTRKEVGAGEKVATVTHQVLAKHAARSCEGHRMLHNEAMLYNMFPRELMDAVDPEGHPPVVPKFYGFYVPLTGWVDIDDHAPCKFRQGPSRADWCRSEHALLLMENCGETKRRREHWTGLTNEEKSQVFSALKRLHDSGFSHGSIRIDNIVIQRTPSPCSHPGRKRPTSDDGVSLRVVDFGRGYSLKVLQAKRGSPRIGQDEFDRLCNSDNERADGLELLAPQAQESLSRRLEIPERREGDGPITGLTTIISCIFKGLLTFP